MSACSIEGCSKPSLYKSMCHTHYNRVRVYGDPHMYKRICHTGSNEERFWAKVKKSEDCWEWQAYKQPSGYGHFMTDDGKTNMVHRLAYELLIGPIPPGMQIDHKCHNRGCVNPAHLRPVTSKQNVENQSGVRSDNRHGFRGVGYNKRTEKYRARVWHRGQDHYAGEFFTPQEAAEAARQLRLKLFTHNDLDRSTNHDNAARRIGVAA